MIDGGMSYIRIADVCEEVYKDSYYSIGREEAKKVYWLKDQNMNIVKKISKYLWQLDWFYNMFWSLVDKLNLQGRYFADKKNNKTAYEKWKEIELVSERKIQCICDNIVKAINGKEEN
jgi:hypothetical protein